MNTAAPREGDGAVDIENGSDASVDSPPRRARQATAEFKATEPDNWQHIAAVSARVVASLEARRQGRAA